MAARKVSEAVPGEIAEAAAEPVHETIAAASPEALPGPAAVAALPAPERPQTTDFGKTGFEANANMEKAMKTAEEFVSFGQANLEAMMKSSQIWAAGVQDIGKQFAATAQAQVDHTVATMKAFAGIKSLKEAMDLQSNLARASMEKAVTETSKLTDASMKLAEQTLAPITARVTLAMEKFGRTV